MTSQTTNKFSPEVRDRAVRMVLDHEAEHPSQPGPTRLRALRGAGMNNAPALSLSEARHIRVAGRIYPFFDAPAPARRSTAPREVAC